MYFICYIFCVVWNLCPRNQQRALSSFLYFFSALWCKTLGLTLFLFLLSFLFFCSSFYLFHPQCVSCGPEDSGLCVMFGTCCSSQYGCYFMTPEAAPCRQRHIHDSCVRRDLMPSCGRKGICVAEALCCSPNDGACIIDASCSTTRQKNNNNNM